MKSGSCWGMSPSPGPGQVPICHSRWGLEAGLINLVGDGSDKGARVDVLSAFKEACDSCALPRVAQDAFCLQECLIQGVPRADSGAVESQARKSLLPSRPPQGLSCSTGEVQSCPEPTQLPLCLIYPSTISLPSSLWPFRKYVLGWGAHSLSRPLPHFGLEGASCTDPNVCLCWFPPACPSPCLDCTRALCPTGNSPSETQSQRADVPQRTE